MTCTTSNVTAPEETPPSSEPRPTTALDPFDDVAEPIKRALVLSERLIGRIECKSDDLVGTFVPSRSDFLPLVRGAKRIRTLLVGAESMLAGAREQADEPIDLVPTENVAPVDARSGTVLGQVHWRVRRLLDEIAHLACVVEDEAQSRESIVDLLRIAKGLQCDVNELSDYLPPTTTKAVTA